MLPSCYKTVRNTVKLVCDQNDLSAKLSLLSRIVPANPTHPVLANVLLTAETGRLGLAVFDLNLGMQIWIPAQTEESGAITIPARFLNDIVSRLPSAPVTIQTEGISVHLACAQGRYQFQGIEAEEFPGLPVIDQVEPLLLSAQALVSGLQSSLFAASNDESKQILTGLHLSSQPDSLEFAATDGHRLAVATSPQPTQTAEMTMTVPAKALRELERLLARQDVDLMVRFDPTQIVFEFATDLGTARLSSRLLEGQYPAYNQLIPRQFARQITIERQLFVAALERIAVLAAQKNNIVKLKIDSVEQQVGLSAEAPQFGSGEESLPAQISGEDLEIAFNVRYLVEGLKAMDSTEIQLQLNSETTPAIVSPLAGRKMTYLIMPIQIRA